MAGSQFDPLAVDTRQRRRTAAEMTALAYLDPGLEVNQKAGSGLYAFDRKYWRAAASCDANRFELSSGGLQR